MLGCQSLRRARLCCSKATRSPTLAAAATTLRTVSARAVGVDLDVASCTRLCRRSLSIYSRPLPVLQCWSAAWRLAICEYTHQTVSDTDDGTPCMYVCGNFFLPVGRGYPHFLQGLIGSARPADGIQFLNRGISGNRIVCAAAQLSAYQWSVNYDSPCALRTLVGDLSQVSSPQESESDHRSSAWALPVTSRFFDVAATSTRGSSRT